MQKQDLLSFSVSSLCRGMDVLVLRDMLEAVSYRIISKQKESVVLSAGSRYNELHILLEGSVQAVMDHENGKSVLIESIEAPDPIAPAILFAPRQVLPVTVLAESDCRILVLPLETVLDLCQKNRRFLINFLTEIGGKLSLFAEKFKLLEFSSLRRRIAVFLSDRLEQGTYTLPFPKEKLAEYLSVARPSLSRELSEMVSEGILKIDGRTITVLNQEKFKTLLME
ncbi:Crp/Fnr family transcriptional regulator [Gracilinema caldarium]|uniref:Crp/Fnr family transcriptional regulator n=1 Tax=Gracilinema caldarium TaxID=215591 RepID=UPI0026EA97A5|nr:Crp/Fnr family transcriptional regulator [Gracilinema caldarium]